MPNGEREWADASAQVDAGDVATTDADDGGASGLGVSGIGLLLFVVLGLLLILPFRRRRDDEEDEE